MSERSPVDRLEQAVQQLLGGGMPSGADRTDAAVGPLAQIAVALHALPRPDFRRQLRQQLERTASMRIDVEQPASVRQTITPRLRVKNAPAAIEFYKNAFGARELMRFTAGNQVPHADLMIGNGLFMVGEAAPEWGYPGPDALGGSPVGMHIAVDDADAAIDRAVAAGARLVAPASDQFYGDRTGEVADPFGYRWTFAQRLEDLSIEEMHRRFETMMAAKPSDDEPIVPAGYHTVTPYLVVQDAPALITFLELAFGAKEQMRAIGSAGGVHAEVQIGDSRLMLGGGAPELSWRGRTLPSALHVYVADTDAAFRRAVDAGATAIDQPRDQEYGERSASVKDPQGNHWYIATAKGAHHVPEGLQTVNVYLHPLRAEPVLQFLTRAFGATGIEKYASPDGVIHHARATIGDTVIEMGEAHGPYQPMPTMFYVHVADVDAAYRRAMGAGAASISEPADQAYGARHAGVRDPFGNEWYVARAIGRP